MASKSNAQTLYPVNLSFCESGYDKAADYPGSGLPSLIILKSRRVWYLSWRVFLGKTLNNIKNNVDF